MTVMPNRKFINFISILTTLAADDIPTIVFNIDTYVIIMNNYHIC